MPSGEYWPNVAIDSLGDNGEPVSGIVSRTRDYVIYTTTSGKPGFEAAPSFVAKRLRTIEEFDELVVTATHYLPKRHRKFVFQRLGYQLANYFAGDSPDEKPRFGASRVLINDIIDDSFQYIYILSSLMAVILLTLYVFFSPLTLFQDVIEKSANLGAVGSLISVLSRSKKLRADIQLSSRFAILQGFVRIFIGATFGAILYLLVEANIVLGVFSNHPLHTSILSFVAGLNERFVPEALKYADT